PVPFLRIRGVATPGGATAQLRLRASVRQGFLGAGHRPDVLAAAGRRGERLRLITRTRIARCLIGGGSGVADLRYLVPGNAAGRARRPVAASAEVPRRSAVPVVAGPVVASPVVARPVVASRERGVA